MEIRRSVWTGSLSRGDTGNGTLGGMIESDAASVHSNPRIFQRAISKSSLHDQQPRELAESEDHSLSRGARLWWIIGRSWRAFSDSFDELVEVMQGKSRRGVRRG